MAIDAGLVKNFENQIEILTKLQEGVQKSIEIANRQLVQLKNGEPIEKVFSTPVKAKSRGSERVAGITA